MAGLTSKTLTHHGRHYQFRSVPMELEPVQRPHPPLWQGVTSAESATAAARRGASVVGHGPIAGLRLIVDAYLSAWDGRAPSARKPSSRGPALVVAHENALLLTPPFPWLRPPMPRIC